LLAVVEAVELLTAAVVVLVVLGLPQDFLLLLVHNTL
jgi:hypothetical protein